MPPCAADTLAQYPAGEVAHFTEQQLVALLAGEQQGANGTGGQLPDLAVDEDDIDAEIQHLLALKDAKRQQRRHSQLMLLQQLAVGLPCSSPMPGGTMQHSSSTHSLPASSHGCMPLSRNSSAHNLQPSPPALLATSSADEAAALANLMLQASSSPCPTLPCGGNWAGAGQVDFIPATSLALQEPSLLRGGALAAAAAAHDPSRHSIDIGHMQHRAVPRGVLESGGHASCFSQHSSLGEAWDDGLTLQQLLMAAPQGMQLQAGQQQQSAAALTPAFSTPTLSCSALSAPDEMHTDLAAVLGMCSMGSDCCVSTSGGNGGQQRPAPGAAGSSGLQSSAALPPSGLQQQPPLMLQHSWAAPGNPGGCSLPTIDFVHACRVQEVAGAARPHGFAAAPAAYAAAGSVAAQRSAVPMFAGADGLAFGCGSPPSFGAMPGAWAPTPDGASSRSGSSTSPAPAAAMQLQQQQQQLPVSSPPPLPPSAASAALAPRQPGQQAPRRHSIDITSSCYPSYTNNAARCAEQAGSVGGRAAQQASSTDGRRQSRREGGAGSRSARLSVDAAACTSSAPRWAGTFWHPLAQVLQSGQPTNKGTGVFLPGISLPPGGAAGPGAGSGADSGTASERSASSE